MQAKQITLWSIRNSAARGNFVQEERKVYENEAQQWIEIFRADEPKVLFIASAKKPKIK